MNSSVIKITELLHRARSGDPVAANTVLEAALPRLLNQARYLLSRYPSQVTLQPGDLVSEGYLRLGGWHIPLNCREHFFRLFGRSMSQVLADRSRRSSVRNRAIELLDNMLVHDVRIDASDLGSIGFLLDDYQLIDPVSARAIRLHYIEGFTWNETARILNRPLWKVRELAEYGLNWLKKRL